MAQTSPWLSVGEAAVRLGVTEHEARALAISGRIRSRLADCNHRELEAAAVEEYAKRGSELAAREGEDLAETAGRSVRGGPELPAHIEDEYERSKGDL